MHRLSMRAEHLALMVAHVRQAWPEEGAGLLGGPAGRVESVYPIENALHSRVEYRLDPAEQVRVMLEIDAAGWELCGIFHSHPAGPDGPSATDVARAYYPEAVYVILTPESGQAGRPLAWQARGYRIDAGQVHSVPIGIEPDSVRNLQ
jgi:proteasome lid subunit RPN8/RPN11